jgi:menaquinone-dependent protoporphyrinogen oxidase
MALARPLLRHDSMKPILILYATREGHTRRVADRVAATLHTCGHDAVIHNASAIPEPFDLDAYAAVVLAASVHGGKHEPELTAFVKRHRAALEGLPTAFLSVSLSEAGAEDMSAPAEKRGQAAANVQSSLDAFIADTGFRPERMLPIAGALLYTQYGWFLRFVMKRIAKSMGASTDTSRDHEFTDWSALDRFVEKFAATVGAPAGEDRMAQSA